MTTVMLTVVPPRRRPRPRIYYALSTLDAQMSGWSIEAMRPTRTGARAAAVARIEADHPPDSIERQTLLANLLVTSKTRARRYWKITDRDEDAYTDALVERAWMREQELARARR